MSSLKIADLENSIAITNMLSDPILEVTASTQQQVWWREAWLGARKRIITILTELMVSTALGLSLALFYVLFRIFMIAGLPSDAFQFLEWLDSWAIRAVFSPQPRGA
jgi:dolichyl-phosphate-mannose--protein O-mannosyl transferase